LLTQ
jgi:hypothetical protein